jgi:hypothetical protein
MKNLIIALLLMGFIGMLSVGCDRFFPPENYSGEDFFRFTVRSILVSERTTEPVMLPVIFSSAEGENASGSVSFEIEGGTPGTDYTILNPTNTLTFNQSLSFRDTVLIRIEDNDEDVEDNVILTVNLINPSSGVVGFPGPSNDTANWAATIEIFDDE